MTPEEYIEFVKKTESIDFHAIRERLLETRTIRLLHAAIGMCTEAGEMLDALKKFIFYGKDLDVINLKEELGDSDWYKAIAVDELEFSFEEIWQLNIAKLKQRYGISFNQEGAIERDLDAERYILEKKNPSKDLRDLQEAIKLTDVIENKDE